jgi:glucose/arabinose dehydrogenase
MMSLPSRIRNLFEAVANRCRSVWRYGPVVILASGLVGLPTAGPVMPPGAEISLTPLISGLVEPTHITHAGDNSGRLFITEQPGRIRIVENGNLLPLPFLDITGTVRDTGSEEGLLSVAFPPDYANQGHFYVYYTNNAGNNVVARYEVTGNPDVADPNSEEIVLTINHPTNSNHNGGQLAFGPADGYLYIGTGDGGGAGDQPNNAQNPNSLLGKILRLDVETGNPATYLIPPSNPYTQTAGYRDEIWALGLRNPWRFSFDRQTHDLYIADVGQEELEEVDFQAASSLGGENYGWRILEGSACFNPPTNCTPPSRYSPPVDEYDHSLGCAITGGFVYRGPRSGSPLRGVYVYSDSCTGNLWVLKQVNGVWMSRMVGTAPFGVSTFGEDQLGNLYLADYGGGSVYRIY